ncbi:hypothetical protein QPK24_04345 [Paenibacillus polygoni]|uniref:Uncharacterized protein n=1 Tax=Paenibacillus polygoni TaxID=3050112 RepID=A0ABY8X463_9BACL|nr:hypothetical protein [Paenibacillus polygoni]WIV19954.1 hypothetical protein QPK24_04345 [Paenibacillus polygoni]
MELKCSSEQMGVPIAVELKCSSEQMGVPIAVELKCSSEQMGVPIIVGAEFSCSPSRCNHPAPNTNALLLHPHSVPYAIGLFYYFYRAGR